MPIIEHTEPCENELRGELVRLAILSGQDDQSVREIEASREALRQDTPEADWKCSCARLRVKRLGTEIDRARKAGDPRYDDLLTQRRDLCQALQQVGVVVG